MTKITLVTMAVVVLTLRRGQNENKALGTPRVAPVTFEVPARHFTDWNEEEAQYLVSSNFARIPTSKDIFPTFNVPDHLPLVGVAASDAEKAEEIAAFNAEVERRNNEQEAARLLAEQEQARANKASADDAARLAAEAAEKQKREDEEKRAQKEAAKEKTAQAKSKAKAASEEIVNKGSTGEVKPSEAAKLKADADKSSDGTELV